MKNKLILISVITSLVFTMLPCGLCFGAEPAVTREYISRKVKGVRSEEEKVCVDYDSLRMEQGDYVKISFFDESDNLIEEHYMELSVNDLLKNEIKYNSQELQGTEYIEVELVSSEYEFQSVKIPFKI